MLDWISPAYVAAAGCTSGWVDDQRSGSLSSEMKIGWLLDAAKPFGKFDWTQLMN